MGVPAGPSRTVTSTDVRAAPAAELMGSQPGLVLLYAPRYELFKPAYPIDKKLGRLMIGREPDCDIPISERAVSRRHARIEDYGRGWILKDLGGKNGTIVDGRSIQEIELQPLHEIRIGDAIFKFVERGAEGYARYRIDGAVIGEDVPPRPPTLVGGYQIARIASALERGAKTPISILLTGETGTGKELFAELVHRASGRRGKLIAVNCAALPPTLAESELFGHRRGAFSGATHDKPGLVRAATGGTLLLDEIGDLPLEVQSKLLRLLQSKQIIPLGSSEPEQVDVRVVCATHRDLSRLRREGSFRDDLFARLAELTIALPPLRERKEDIYSLARSFLDRHGGAHLSMGFSFMVGLIHHDYPLNVRELESCIKRAIAIAETSELTTEHLPEELQENMRSYDTRAAARHVADGSSADIPTESTLRELLRAHRGNLSAVSRELNKGRMQIHRWARHYGILIEEYR